LDPRPDQRYWLLQELEALLEEAALREPLLLVIDDLQWADGATLLALRTLVPQLAPVPILWIFAVRSLAAGADLRSTLTRLVDAGAVRISLGPLPAKAVSEVAADRLDAEADPRLLRLADHSGGNPYLLVELLDGLREEGLVRVEHGRAELVHELLPARVREGVRDRLDGLSAEAREAVRLAAVLGRRFSVDRLAVVGGSTPPELLGPVAELMRADLVAELDGRLVFRHDLVREAVLETIPASMRVALQRHAALVRSAPARTRSTWRRCCWPALVPGTPPRSPRCGRRLRSWPRPSRRRPRTSPRGRWTWPGTMTRTAAPWSPRPCCGCTPRGGRARLRPWPQGSSSGRCRQSRRRRSC
jgi:hypothetical protein